MNADELHALNSDLSYAVGLVSEISVADIKEVMLEITGENDGPDWHWILKLTGRRVGYITAGCDYTGWGCHGDHGHASVHNTMKQALRDVPENERRVFEDMLAKGEKVRAA